MEKKWQTELAMQGRDYAVAIKTAHMMQKLGLVDVDVRMNDTVEFITTQYADYEETKNDFIAYNDWTSGIRDEQKESKGYFIPYTFEHFDKKEHDRLTRAFREECLFTKAGNEGVNNFVSMKDKPFR